MSEISTDPCNIHGKRSPLRVIVTMDNAPGNLDLLSPGRGCEWGRCTFLLNPPQGTEADFWIVAANARPFDRMRVASENTMFIAAEPLQKKVYPRNFYQQFHWLVDSHTESLHPRLTTAALGFCWHIGLQQPSYRYSFGYDHLQALTSPTKQNRISVVCSSNRFTEGQRQRLDFLEQAKKELGDSIVHFGRGFTPIGDKLDAILPYRFHLALENCEQPFYFSEKIADAYLGWAFPLYLGCPNLEDFLPPASFARISPDRPLESIELMRRMLESPVTPDELRDVEAGRDAILNVFSPFAVWARWAEEKWQPVPAQLTVLRSHKAFRSILRGFVYRLRTWNQHAVESNDAA